MLRMGKPISESDAEEADRAIRWSNMWRAVGVSTLFTGSSLAFWSRDIAWDARRWTVLGVLAVLGIALLVYGQLCYPNQSPGPPTGGDN